MKIAVVILNWNGKDHLRNFLPSVVANSNMPGVEIFVADNASTDESVDLVKREFPSVKVIQLQQNYGFAKGYNEALQMVESDLYLLINSDVEVTQNWLEPLVQLMENDSSIAACQPKIKSYREKSNFEHAGAAGGWIDKFGYPFCRGRIFDSVEEDKGQYNDTTEIFWATGACLCIKASLFHEAGGFDDHFYAHMEEIDLCWRLKNKGYKIFYSPESTVYHLGGGTLTTTNPLKTYLNFRNGLFLLVKNYPGRKLFFLLIFRLCLDGIAAIKFLVEGNRSHFVSVVKAHCSFYSRFLYYINKRSTNKRKALPALTGVYHKSIVWQYYIRGIRYFSQLPGL